MTHRCGHTTEDGTPCQHPVADPAQSDCGRHRLTPEAAGTACGLPIPDDPWGQIWVAPIEQLGWVADHPDAGLRHMAVQRMGTAAEWAQGDPDPEVRLAYVEAVLQDWQQPAEKVRWAVSDPEPRVREAALKVLTTSSQDQATTVEAIDDPDPTVRAAAIRSRRRGYLLHPEDLGGHLDWCLQRLQTETDPTCSVELARAAMAAVGAQHAQASEFGDRLARALAEHPMPSVRLAFWRRWGNADTYPDVEYIRRQPSEIRLLLVSLEKIAHEQRAWAKDDPDPAVRAQYLSEVPWEGHLNWAFHDPDPRVRRAAVAMAPIQELGWAQTDPDDSVRATWWYRTGAVWASR